MVKLRTKLIWIAVSVAIFIVVWTGVFITEAVNLQKNGKDLLRRLEKNHAITLPQNVTCKRMISDGFTGYDTYAYYEVNDSNFIWTNGKGEEFIEREEFEKAFFDHFHYLMTGCEPILDKAYEYNYYKTERRWEYIIYIPEDKVLAIGIYVD